MFKSIFKNMFSYQIPWTMFISSIAPLIFCLIYNFYHGALDTFVLLKYFFIPILFGMLIMASLFCLLANYKSKSLLKIVNFLPVSLREITLCIIADFEAEEYIKYKNRSPFKRNKLYLWLLVLENICEWIFLKVSSPFARIRKALQSK